MSAAPARVDAHAHMLPAELPAELERRELLRFPLPPWSEEALDALMARHAIDAAVLSLSPPGVWFGDQDLADDLARRVNEQIAAKVAREPRRFGGLAVLPLPDIDRALAELAHAFDVLGPGRRILSSNMDGVYLGDPSLDPLMAELDRRGAYVLLHPTVPPNPLPLPQHPMWLYEFPFDTTRAVVNMVYSGTIARYPDIRWQISHLGGAATFLAQRIASLADREPEKAAARGRRRASSCSAGSGTTPACRTTGSPSPRRARWRPTTASSSAPTGPTRRCRRTAIPHPSSTCSVPAAPRSTRPTPRRSCRGSPAADRGSGVGDQGVGVEDHGLGAGCRGLEGGAEAARVVARVEHREDEAGGDRVVLGEAAGGELGVAGRGRVEEPAVLRSTRLPDGVGLRAVLQAVALRVVEPLAEHLARCGRRRRRRAAGGTRGARAACRTCRRRA